MKRRGRPILAAIFGLLTGLFAAVSLLAFGVIPLDSIVVTALPLATLVVAFVLAMWAPFGPSTYPAPRPPNADRPPETSA